MMRSRKRGTQKYYVYTKPSKKAIQSIKDKVNVSPRLSLTVDQGFADAC